ncbi:MAG: SDR family oxidoreductase [Bacteroidota bacterium]|nr:SDR family oxidoreductase [Bacteroidota bacterium]
MKYVLILGAGSDIARPLSKLYAQGGYGVYLASRNMEKLARDAEDLKIRYNVDVTALKFDVTEIQTHQSFYNSLPIKPVGVVCIAGYLGSQEIAENNFSESLRIISVNFTGCVSILNIIADDFEHRHEGFIVGVSSVAGERGRKKNYIYGAAKSGFTTYLSGLRNRLYSSNVHVLTVHPGFVETKMTAGLPLPGLMTAQPEEVARDIFQAQQSEKDFLYSKWIWRYIMVVIRAIPEFVFKKLSIG